MVLGLTGGSVNPLVGSAISAALLPPLVNSGMTTMIGAINPDLSAGEWDYNLHQVAWV